MRRAPCHDQAQSERRNQRDRSVGQSGIWIRSGYMGQYRVGNTDSGDKSPAGAAQQCCRQTRFHFVLRIAMWSLRLRNDRKMAVLSSWSARSSRP